MKVAVLGCGPSGVVAAHAASRAGAEVSIFSKKRRSHMFGAQYLHERIPGTQPGPTQAIHYKLEGTPEGYKTKVYGPNWPGKVSPEEFAGVSLAFDIRATYEELWDVYESVMVDKIIDHNFLGSATLRSFDYVFSTIPMPQICVAAHSFTSQDIWAMGDAPERGQEVPVRVPEGTVICNGEESPSWYRASNIFGYKTVEWSILGAKPVWPVSKVTKPLLNTCTCWPDIIPVGRYGGWRKGILVHHVFDMVSGVINGKIFAAETRTHHTPCPWADDSLTRSTKIQLGCHCV